MADGLRSALFEGHGLIAAFFGRRGGVSPVPFDSLNFRTGLGDEDTHIATNMDILVRSLGLATPPHQTLQAHGTEILLCRGGGRFHRQAADALISDTENTALAVRTADCLPVLLADPKTGLIAAAHAGWRGTAACIVKHVIRDMQRRGARADRIIASLGPCIGPCCFRIDERTAARLAGSVKGTNHHIRQKDHGDIHADLRAINCLQLLQSGLNAAHIEQLPACTCCHTDDYFSYRRDGAETGRQLAVVARPAKP